MLEPRHPSATGGRDLCETFQILTIVSPTNEFDIELGKLFRIKGLSPGQQKLCLLYTDHMVHVGRGARSGIGNIIILTIITVILIIINI